MCGRVLGAVGLVLAACGGARPAAAPVPAHAAAPSQPDLFADLPGGEVALFGGDVPRLQKTVVAWLTQLVVTASGDHAAGDQMGRWMDCLGANPGRHQVGGVAIRDGHVETRYVMSGVGLPELAACGRRAGFGVQLDPDGKYLEIAMQVGARHVAMGHLLLPDGAVYSRWGFGLSGVPWPHRAELEADHAGAGGGNADRDLVALTHQVDQGHTSWFVVRGAGTSLAEQLDSVVATVDLAGDLLALDATTVLADEKPAQQLEDAFGRMQRRMSRLPPEWQEALARITLHRDGRTVRVQIRLRFAQITALVQALRHPRHDTADMRAVIAKMGTFRDDMCQCHDSACAQRVSEEMTRWSQQMQAQQRAPARPTDAEARQMTDITKQLTDCMVKAMGATTPAGSGSP